MTLVDEEVARLWALLTELSAQLSANQEHCNSLRAQSEELKKQAVHTGTGFALRRFNVDITKETFESEVERFNAWLVVENQALLYENKQLSHLLKDYEGTLDSIMARFRGFAASTQQFELESSRQYEAMLMDYTHGASGSNAPYAAEPATDNRPHSNSISNGGLLQDPVTLQLSLANLASLVRKALRSVQGEAVEASSSSDEESESSSSSSAGGTVLDDDIADGPPDMQRLSARLDGHSINGDRPSSAVRLRSRTPMSSSSSKKRAARFTKHDRSEGGYLRLVSDNIFSEAASEIALENDTEIERLTKENEALRALLKIATEPMPEVVADIPLNPPSILSSPRRTGFAEASGSTPPRRTLHTTSPTTRVNPIHLSNTSAIEDDDDEDDDDDDGHTYFEDISLAEKQQAAPADKAGGSAPSAIAKAHDSPKTETRALSPVNVQLERKPLEQVSRPLPVPVPDRAIGQTSVPPVSRSIQGIPAPSASPAAVTATIAMGKPFSTDQQAKTVQQPDLPSKAPAPAKVSHAETKSIGDAPAPEKQTTPGVSQTFTAQHDTPSA